MFSDNTTAEPKPEKVEEIKQVPVKKYSTYAEKCRDVEPHKWSSETEGAFRNAYMDLIGYDRNYPALGIDSIAILLHCINPGLLLSVEFFPSFQKFNLKTHSDNKIYYMFEKLVFGHTIALFQDHYVYIHCTTVYNPMFHVKRMDESDDAISFHFDIYNSTGDYDPADFKEFLCSVQEPFNISMNWINLGHQHKFDKQNCGLFSIMYALAVEAKQPIKNNVVSLYYQIYDKMISEGMAVITCAIREKQLLGLYPDVSITRAPSNYSTDVCSDDIDDDSSPSKSSKSEETTEDLANKLLSMEESDFDIYVGDDCVMSGCPEPWFLIIYYFL